MKTLLTTGLLFLSVCLFISAADCPAFTPSRPMSALTLYSEYISPDNPALTYSRQWRVVPESMTGGDVRLRFFLNTDRDADALCELLLPPVGVDGEIRWQSFRNGSEKSSSSGLLLLPGYPVPCDVLPLDETDGETLYRDKTRAGDSVFTRSYRVSVNAVGLETARDNGWIRDGGPGDTKELVLVTALDEGGQVAVRQLWPTNGSWWVYEETPVRRSWLIGP